MIKWPALIRLEGSILARRRTIPLLALAGVVLFYLTVSDTAPDLYTDSISLAVSLLPLAAGSLAIAYFEAVRIRTGSFGEILLSTPAGQERPHVAQSVALSGFCVLASLVVLGLGLVYLATGDPVRELVVLEVSVGVAAVILAASIGGLIGARARLRGLVAIAILAFGLLQLGSNPDVGILGLEGPASVLQPMAPIQLPSQFVPLDVVDRNTSARLILVVALAAIAWGGTHVSRRHLWVPGSVVLAGAIFAVLSWQTSVPEQPTGGELAVFYDSERQCQTIDTVRACSYPDFEPWGDRWVEAINSGPLADWLQVESIIQVAVGEAESRAERMTRAPGVLRTDMSWDREGSSGSNTAALRLQAALGAVELPETMGDDQGGCFAGGQARAVVALWLAGSGSGERAMTSWLSRADSSNGEAFWIGDEPAQVLVTSADVGLALSMLTSSDIANTERMVTSIRSGLSSGSLASSELAASLGLPYEPTELTQDWGSPCA